MSTFMAGNTPTYMYIGHSYDEEHGTFGQHPNQQTYEGLYDSYHPTHVTEELLSGQAPNGMLAAAHLTPTPDSFFPLPQLQLQPYYGFDVNGNVCCWQFPTAIPSCCQSHAPTLLAPVNSNFVDQPPTLPPFGYGPIAGGGVPPRAFDIRQQVPTRESSVQSSAFTNNIWSPVQLQPSPAPSFTESTGRSTTCSPIEHNEDLAYWSGPQYFAYPRFAQAEADAWDVQAYPDPIAASIQQYTVSQTFPWSLPQPAAPAPALAPSSLSSDQFSVAVPTEPHDSATHDPTTTTSPSTIHVTTPPSIPASSTSSFDSNPAPRPARRPRAVPASFKIRKNNIINPKAKIPEAWELEVVALKEKHTYSQIQRIIAAKYGVQKAISTIRGVKRNVVLPPHLRPRKAEWGPEHLTALRLGFPRHATFAPDGAVKSVAWVKLCKYIEQQTGFPFGPTATHRIYNERLHVEDPEQFPFVGVVGKSKSKGKGKAKLEVEDMGMDMDMEDGEESVKSVKRRRQHGGRKALKRCGWRYAVDEQEDVEQEEEDGDEGEQDEEEGQDDDEEEL